MRGELFDKLGGEGVGIAETVKALRKILAKDQAAFSEEVGIGLSTLRRIEQEDGNVTLETLRKIFERFGLELVVRTKREGEGP